MKTNLNTWIACVLFLISFLQGTAQQQNYLTASGNKLYDSSGEEVRLTGVNWFGFETALYHPHGIWSRDMKSVLQQIKDLGFNTIRVPWCNEMLDTGASVNVNSYGSDTYTGISPMNEQEAKVSTPIELLDIFVNWCQENDMKIVLDNHSRAADGFLNEAYWYTSMYSEERWIRDWVFIANRYKGKSAVVAMDLNNEPHGSTWGDSHPSTDWNKAAERCGNAVLEANPDVLIIVEGVGEFEGESYWWGGQLMGAKKYPIQLSNPSKLVYSAHEYGPEVAQQDWFEDYSFPNNMPGIWNKHYDYLYQNNTSPIFVGEFGIRNQNAFGGIAYTWFTEFMDFMGDRYSWTFWTMNPNSGDTGGILQDDWTNVNQWKLDVLQPHVAPLIPNVIGGTPPQNRAPIARFTANNGTCGGPEVVFDAGASSDPDGDVLTYSWDLGDGTTADGVSLSYRYDDLDTVMVTLTVSDGVLSGSQTIEINLLATPCPAPTIDTLEIIASTTSGAAPLSVSFDAMVTMFQGTEDDVDFIWDFGNATFGNGQSVIATYTDQGVYTIVLQGYAPGNEVVVSLQLTVTAGDSSTGTCAFGAPLDAPLATIPNTSYSNIQVLGNGGPNLSNVTNFTINWDLVNNGLWQFSMNTNNGIPNWWNDLKQNSMLSQNLDSARPGLTLEGTDFPNLDGSYYATRDGDNFALVATDGSYTIYFSNDVTVPNCTVGAKFSQNLPVTVLKVFPNPVADRVVIHSSVSLKGATIQMIDSAGRVAEEVAVTYDTKEVVLEVSKLVSGMYFIKLFHRSETTTLQFLKV